MPTERLLMRQIREILRLRWACGLPQRAVARACGAGLGTVSEYCRRAAQAGLSWPLPDDLDDRQLEARLFQRVHDLVGIARPLPDMAWLHQELKRPGVTLQRLWLEYLDAHPDGYRYSQFCRHYERWVRTLAPTMRQVHRAGEKAFVDFSGQRPVLCDPKTGELIPVELFIGVLGASNYTYAEACLTQDLPSWISVHVRMLEYFHGSPAILVPDNLRSGVTQACRYEPMINRTYLAFARHYGIAIVPARSGRPRDKAKVEAGVLLAQRWILAALRHRRFFRLAELNAAIRELLTPLIAGGKLTQSRRSSQRSSGRLPRDSVWRISSHCCEIPGQGKSSSEVSLLHVKRNVLLQHAKNRPLRPARVLLSRSAIVVPIVAIATSGPSGGTLRRA